MKRALGCFALLVVWTCVSCGDKLDPDQSAPDVELGDANESVTYSVQIKPLLDASCAGCHSGSSPTAGVDMGSYAGAKRNANAARQQILSEGMPPGSPWPDFDKALFGRWIDQGSNE